MAGGGEFRLAAEDFLQPRALDVDADYPSRWEAAVLLLQGGRRLINEYGERTVNG